MTKLPAPRTPREAVERLSAEQVARILCDQNADKALDVITEIVRILGPRAMDRLSLLQRAVDTLDAKSLLTAGFRALIRS